MMIRRKLPKQREPRWCTMCIAYGHEDEDCPEQEPEDEEPGRPAPEWEEPKRPAPEWEEPERPAPEWEEPECPAPEWEEPKHPKPKREESVRPQPKRGESERPAPKRGKSERPAPKRGESVHPAPKRGESVHPQPKREESVHPQPKREESVHPQPKREESVHPQPKREESVHPQPKREESVHPQPKREESVHPQPKREESVRPQPKRGKAEHPQPRYLPAEGEYLLVPPPSPWEDDESLRPPPAEGEYLLVPPPPPWEDDVSLPPPPAEGEFLLVPPPWEDCVSLPPPPAEGEFLLVPPPPPWEDYQQSAAIMAILKNHISKKNRKDILRFLDAEKDVSVVKSSFKPGDVIHYVLDRRRTLNISHNLHSLLPEVSPMKNRRFKTCAVVGNSGILLDSGCGNEIDSHDFVIRCNLAPLSEFAEDVGMSSDFITMNPSVIQRVYGGFKNESDREKFVQRLAMLNGSVLWIPAFMVKGGEKHVEWVNELILKNKLKVRTAYPSLRLIHAVRG
ncbi:UNVERIFIED_CONTAM: hypothetical protein FKN15_061625 [Acipenser sinensis]